MHAPPAPWDSGVVERRLLALHNRRRIVNHVRANPGIHLRQIARDLGLAIGTAEHHMHVLAHHGILEPQAGRRQTAFFVRDGASPEHRRLVAALRSGPQRSLLRALLDDPELDAPALARRVGMPATSASYHLQRLIRDGHLEVLRIGRSRLFRIPQPEALAAALRAVEDGPFAAFPWAHPGHDGPFEANLDQTESSLEVELVRP